MRLGSGLGCFRDEGGILELACGDVVEEGTEFVGVVAVGEGCLLGDAAGADEGGEGLVHGAHTVGVAGGDLGADLMVLAGADEVADGGGGDHDLEGGVAGGLVDGGDELLGDDGEEGEGELLADLVLVAGGKAVEETDHGLGGVVGVEGGEDEVACFGGGEGGGHGFGVAHFADEDDVGVLAEDGSDGLCEAGGVVADFDLFDDGVAVGVLVLDGVFDGDDVVAAAGVDVVDEGCHGGCLAAAGGTGEEDEALAALGELGEDGGKVQGVEGGNLGGEEAKAGGEGAALVVDVGAEAGGVADEAEVEGAGGFELFGLGVGEERKKEVADVFGGEGFAAGGGEDAVDAEGGGGSGDEEDVGGVLFVGLGKVAVDGGAGVEREAGLGFGGGDGVVELVDELGEVVFVVGHGGSVVGEG